VEELQKLKRPEAKKIYKTLELNLKNIIKETSHNI
jgi:mRNA-degrading endonuclease RelE of RelBE toxin-antitoxin system